MGMYAFALASVAATLAILPFAATPGPELTGIVPLFCGVVIMVELATAALLLARFREARVASVLLLAAAYFYSALVAVLHLLTFPGALVPGRPLVVTSGQSTSWVFQSWMWGFALLALAAVVAELRGSGQRFAQAEADRAAARMLACVLLAVVLVGFGSTLFVDVLPRLVEGQTWTPLNLALSFGSPLLLALSLVLIGLRRRRLDDLFRWLGAALIVLLSANVLTALSGARYTLGWSLGRVLWATSACVVFIYFLRQFRLQQQVLAQARDRLELDVQASTAELSRSAALLRAVSEGTSDLLYAKDRDSRILFANPAAAQVFSADNGAMQTDNDRRIMQRGEPETVEEVFVTSQGPRTYLSTKAPMRDRGGEIVGLIGVSRDITARKRTEENTRTLLLEVSHRAKNILAVVQAMVRLSVRRDDPEAFADNLTRRLAALATSHDLLVHSEWRGVDLGQLIDAQLRHARELAGDRIVIFGPAVRLQPAAAQTIGMAVHELATNALKYGALSNDHGRVTLNWRLDADFRMAWVERGGPPAAPPATRGYGHAVIGPMVEYALDATIRLEHGPAGIEWHLAAPVAQIVDATGQTGEHELAHPDR